MSIQIITIVDKKIDSKSEPKFYEFAAPVKVVALRYSVLSIIIHRPTLSKVYYDFMNRKHRQNLVE